MSELTEAEKNAIHDATGDYDTLFAAAERIIAARLFAVEAERDQWSEVAHDAAFQQARAESAEMWAARLASERGDALLRVETLARQVAAVESVLADPDDTQWWPVEPYMDPHDADEVVEVAVVSVDRIRAALRADA